MIKSKGIRVDKKGNLQLDKRFKEYFYLSQAEKDYPSYFPPPWNINDHPEKTEGWIEFQKAMREDPKYYLGAK